MAMNFSKRILSVLTLLVATAIPALAAPDQAKPKVRAITGFITIDAKSYPSQIEEAVKFLSRVREAFNTAVVEEGSSGRGAKTRAGGGRRGRRGARRG